MKLEDFKKKLTKTPLFSGDVVRLYAKNPLSMRNQLLRWQKKGFIIQLRKGLYTFNLEEDNRSASKELIAANLYQPSYISLESALSYYKMIPERVVPIMSVTPRKTKTFQNTRGLFIYRHLKKDAYFGFKLMRDEYGFPYFLAEPEKALLDYLYLNLASIQVNDVDNFCVSLRLQNKTFLNKAKLIRYAKRYNTKKLAKVAVKIK